MDHKLIYDRISSDLAELEQFRLKQRKKAFAVFPIALIAISTLAFVLFYFENVNKNWTGYFVMVVFGIMGGVWASAKRQYERTVKDKIMPVLLRALNEGVDYNFDGHITLHQVNNSQLFTRCTHCSGEDLLHGKIDKTVFEISEVKAEKISGSGKNRTQKTIFKGLFMVSDFNKHFHGRTQVFPDVSENLFGTVLGRKFQSSGKNGLELVELENVAFEKEFAVFSDNQTEARYILSPSLMERILRLRKYWGTDIYLSFMNGVMYLAIRTKKDFLSIKFSEPLTTENIRDYYDEILDCLDIIEELNLNTRIWSKE